MAFLYRASAQLTAAILLVSGCGFGVNLDNLYGERPTDAGPRADAATESDSALLRDAGSEAAGDAARESGCQLVNLMENGDFETGKVAPWAADTVKGSAVFVGASYARSGGFGMQLVKDPNFSPGIGSAALANSASGPLYASVYLRSDTPDNAIEFGVLGSSITVLQSDSKYRCAELNVRPSLADKPNVRLTLSGPNNGERSITVDDIAVYAVPVGGIPPECKCPVKP